jgi:GT2 family glycosyltransferase
MPGPPKTILVSILSLGRPRNVLDQLENLPAWLADFELETGTVSHIVVRNNDPSADFTAVAERMSVIEAEFRPILCTLVTGVPNNGFGEGHNSNVALAPSDYVLILNDDIGFPHINWLGDAIRQMSLGTRTVCVGASENPKHINPCFGNGLLPGSFHTLTMPYAEASVLMFDRAAFDALGGFSADFHWAMCEDSDLSLRVQQLGWQVAHMPMPHQHWRSTSFNALPAQVKSSILEHNRAALFANWRDSLATGRVGRFAIYDLWSDGIGDVFCALPHLLARLAPLSPMLRANVVVNTSHPELVAALGLEGVRVTSVKDLQQLRTDFAADGVTTIRSMRDINFSLPFNIHPLLAGALGVETAGPEVQDRFRVLLQNLRLPDTGARLVKGSYCVVHLEFERQHDGRGLSPAAAADLLGICGRSFATIVLVGRERRLSASLFGASGAEIIDLQGKLSQAGLIATIANAGFFVGIDSFPAHVAQASGIKAAIFFGAVHPLTRVWDEDQVWPLTAKLPCIGCYHTHLECSVPFCMRLDVACTTQVNVTDMEQVLACMIQGQPYKWAAFRQGFQALQSRLIKLTRYHPAPPERLFRTQMVANEHISTLIYRVTEQMGNLLREQYHSSAVTQLAARAADLEAETYAAKIALDDAMRSRTAPHGRTGPLPSKLASRILQLNGMDLQTTRCSATIVDQWIEITADEDDPQINLPPMKGPGGKVQLRLSCVAEPEDALQVYWSNSETGFSAERVHTLACTGSLQTVNLAFDLTVSEALYIRIDPTTGAGRSRLRGTLGGMFTLVERAPAPVIAMDEPCDADMADRAARVDPGQAHGRAPEKSAAPTLQTRPRPAKTRLRSKHSVES